MKLKDENPEASDEAVLDMAIQYGNRQAGNPVHGAYALTSRLTNSPLFSGM